MSSCGNGDETILRLSLGITLVESNSTSLQRPTFSDNRDQRRLVAGIWTKQAFSYSSEEQYLTRDFYSNRASCNAHGPSTVAYIFSKRNFAHNTNPTVHPFILKYRLIKTNASYVRDLGTRRTTCTVYKYTHRWASVEDEGRSVEFISHRKQCRSAAMNTFAHLVPPSGIALACLYPHGIQVSGGALETHSSLRVLAGRCCNRYRPALDEDSSRLSFLGGRAS